MTQPSMLHTDQWHPSDEELSAFLGGREIRASQCETIEQHLAQCVDCQCMAESLHADAFERRLVALRRQTENGNPCRLTGGYELIKELGRGGSGIVYRARQPGMAREVAIKMLAAGGRASATELARFRREIASLARLNHANIVRVFDTGEQDGTPYLAMELVDGPTLADWIREQLPEPREAAAVVMALSDAAQSAHEQGIIHRDLKPQNVLLDRAGARASPLETDASPNQHPAKIPGIPKIADFGISQMDDENYRTQTGQVLGTPAYMAPEMAQGHRDAVGPATDVYGMGAILYECLTGRPPFAGSTAAEVLRAVIETYVAPIRSLRREVPRDLETICQRCLRKSPVQRFATAAELRDELGRFLRGEPIRSRPISAVERAARWTRRNPWPVGLAGLMLLTCLAGVWGLLAHQRRLTTERDAARQSYDAARTAIWGMLDSTNRESGFDIPELRQMSLSQFGTAHDLFKRLSEREGTPAAARELARIRIQYGSALIASNDLDTGQQQLEAAYEYLAKQAGQFPDDETLLPDLISSQVKLAHTRNEKREYQAAIDILNQALPLAVAMQERFPDQVRAVNQLSWVYDHLGGVFMSQGEHSRAAEQYGLAIGLIRRAIELDPDNDELPISLAESQISRAACWMASKQAEQAEQAFRDAIVTLDAARVRNPKDFRPINAAAVTYLNLSNISAAKGNLPGAIADCSQGIELLEVARAADPQSAETNDNLCMLYANRAQFKGQNDQSEDSISDWRQAISRSIDEEKTHFCRTMLIRTLATVHQWQTALDEVETALGQVSTSGQRFQLAAAVAHVAGALAIPGSSDATAEPKLRPILDACLKQAQEQLQRLAKEGYFTSDPAAKESVLTSDDFSYIRERFGDDVVASWLE